jgi:hypothetical protein
VIVGILVTSLGLAPAIAAVVGALIIRFFFENGYEAMCEVWQGKVAPGGSGSPA